MEAQYLERLLSSKQGSDEQRFWFDSYVGLAQTPEALARVADWAKTLKVAPGLKLDLDRRWMMVRQLTRYGQKDAPALFAQLKKIDASDRGQKGRLAIEAIQPSFQVKQKWFEIVTQPKPELSLADARSVLGSLFPTEQSDLARRFEADSYEYLKQNGASENDTFVQVVAAAIVPLNCNAQDSWRLKEFLSQPNELAPTVSKELRAELQEDERCQKIRAASALLGAPEQWRLTESGKIFP